MNRILIVEDDAAISNLVKLSLQKAGYACRCTGDGNEAIALADAEPFDLVLLDVMLPGLDGFEILDYLKQDRIPVIFLTAKGSLSDRVQGLKMGAEDYIVKPFEIQELLARVEVVLRRYHKNERTLCIGDLTIDTASMCVRRQGEADPLSLTPKEYELLLFFARNPGIVLYRETIYQQVWGGDLPYGSRTVDLHIQRLRKKTGWENRLQAVNKVGYRLEADHETAP